MFKIMLVAIRKTVKKMKDEYDRQVEEREYLLAQAETKNVQFKSKRVIPMLDTMGKKYPVMLKHGSAKLPPYYLGECSCKGCRRKAIF